MERKQFKQNQISRAKLKPRCSGHCHTGRSLFCPLVMCPFASLYTMAAHAAPMCPAFFLGQVDKSLAFFVLSRSLTLCLCVSVSVDHCFLYFSRDPFLLLKNRSTVFQFLFKSLNIYKLSNVYILRDFAALFQFTPLCSQCLWSSSRWVHISIGERKAIKNRGLSCQFPILLYRQSSCFARPGPYCSEHFSDQVTEAVWKIFVIIKQNLPALIVSIIQIYENALVQSQFLPLSAPPATLHALLLTFRSLQRLPRLLLFCRLAHRVSLTKAARAKAPRKYSHGNLNSNGLLLKSAFS